MKLSISGFVVTSIVIFCAYVQSNETIERESLSPKSPYSQNLPPRCGNVAPIKLTNAKGIICPMVKDEVGFLSEWVAYYEMHGFNKVIIYDNNSTTSYDELSPWIKTNFVEVKTEWPGGIYYSKMRYGERMRSQVASQIDCRKIAVGLGYDIYLAVDIDEYYVPQNRKYITIMDDMVNWFSDTTRGIVSLPRENFASVPHSLEPVNLLTIEAYQSRYAGDGSKMSYYTSVSPKVGLKLTGNGYTSETVEYLIECCDIHGCGGGYTARCRQLMKSEISKLLGPKRPWRKPSTIHHYARSLEKYLLKIDSWQSSLSHESIRDGRGSVDMYSFLSRSLGSHYDDKAVIFSCGLRSVLKSRTGLPYYLRPGDFWYRNIEFGKLVMDGRKRGRHGKGINATVSEVDKNPYPQGKQYHPFVGSG